MVDKKVDQLSKGMQQKIQLFQVINNPKLLILDEPFTGLDCKHGTENIKA